MRGMLSLFWKEYRELRWFLIVALVVFFGFPLIEASGRYWRPPTALLGQPAIKPEFYSDAATGIVLGFGGLLACFVAIGSTTRDLRDELHVFWRSRPVSVVRWMSVKYAAGLLTVIVACTLPMVMQFVMANVYRPYNGDEIAGTVGLHTFTLVLIFSVAFLLGCLVRHTTHAALLALAVMLTIYFLPVILSPLSFLSVFNLMNNETIDLGKNITQNPAGWAFYLPTKKTWRVIIDPVPWSTFVAAMLGGSIAAASLAIVAVRRDWRVEADRKVMHWSLGGVAMLLFGATAFQVGSNLKVNRQFELPVAHHSAVEARFDGTRGALLLRDMNNQQFTGQIRMKLCSFEMTPDGSVSYGPIVSPTDTLNVPYRWNGRILFHRPQRPDRAYLLAEHSGWLSKPVNGRSYNVTLLQLLTIDLTGRSPDPVLHRLDLSPLVPEMQTSARTYQVEGTIYIAGNDHVVAVDLDAPEGPRIARPPIDVSVIGPGNVRTSTLNTYFGQAYDYATGQPMVEVPLLPLPSLSSRQRMEARLRLGLHNIRGEVNGDVFMTADSESVSAYRLASINDTSAKFLLEGQRDRTPLERLVGSYAPSDMTTIDGTFYLEEHRFSSGITAYDMRDSTRPLPVGHFAVPNAPATSVFGLPSGEILVAANRLYILAPPVNGIE
jgi:hypothetical protein